MTEADIAAELARLDMIDAAYKRKVVTAEWMLRKLWPLAAVVIVVNLVGVYTIAAWLLRLVI